MSSKVNEALFDLIQSMSKSEKRYFKLMSSRHTIGDENNYVRLFDFIDKQEEYDEDEVNAHFKGEAFLNRFSITKKRLYDHILSALDSFHISSSIDAQIDKMLHSSDILFEKSLYDQSRRILRSAEKLALKYEKFETLLRITKKQKRLFETRGHLELSESHVQELKALEKKSISAIEKYNVIWNVKTQLFAQLSKKGMSRCEAESDTFKEICAAILAPIDLEDCAVETIYLYHHTLSAYYYAINDYQNSLVHLKENIALFGADKRGDMIEPNKQVSVITNAIYVSDKLGLYRESLQHLTMLKKLANEVDSNEDLSIKLFSSITSIELSICLRKGDFETAQKISGNVTAKLEEYGSKIIPVRRAFLEFKMAVVHMGIGEFSEALKWVNSILNDSELDKTEDIIGFTQLLDLLIHIELNHDKLLPYSLKNTQRFFKTRNRLYSFEKVFLMFIGKLIKSKDPFEIENLWEELYNDLASITDDSFESVALEYFDFKSWAEAKLKRKSFDCVVKEKYNENIKVAS